MHILIAAIVAVVILIGGFALSIVAPRWVSYNRRSALMVAIWVASLFFATAAVAGIA